MPFHNWIGHETGIAEVRRVTRAMAFHAARIRFMAVVGEHCKARNIDMVNRGSSVRVPAELRV